MRERVFCDALWAHAASSAWLWPRQEDWLEAPARVFVANGASLETEQLNALTVKNREDIHRLKCRAPKRMTVQDVPLERLLQMLWMNLWSQQVKDP